MRGFLRRLYMSLATALGIRRLGFFIPYRYAGQIPSPDKRPHYDALEALFKAREDGFHEILADIRALSAQLQAIDNAPPPAPRWRQDWFPGLDAAAAYAMVHKLCPKRIVEVGSGHSTRFMARAAGDGKIDVSITAIDPAPRADITQMGVNVLRKTVQEAGLVPFADLESGDILSIDSSHILMPGSDVDLLFNNVLPLLPEGVVIHIHDIFLPDPYPPSWDWRGYNEQLAVAALLQGGGYHLLWSSRYARTRMSEALGDALFDHIKPSGEAFESSLWLRKRPYS